MPIKEMTWLELARRKAGLTQRAAESHTGIPFASIRNWEQRRSSPRVLAITTLRKCFPLLRRKMPLSVVRVDLDTLEIVPKKARKP